LGSRGHSGGTSAARSSGGADNLTGKGFVPTPCYAWNNTYNGEKLNMTLRRWPNPADTARQAEIVMEGRDFFNERPPAGSYTPYVYPHPLQRTGERAAYQRTITS
jgi:hypothetical protein